MPRLLIVDDDAVDRELARRSLSAFESLTLVEAVDGEEAVSQIDENPPDLVLTDLRMPKLDGLELVRHIRQTHPEIPAVLMTSEGSEKIAVEALLAGAASYVPKSVLKDELPDTIQRVLDMLAAREARGRVLRYLDRTETHFDLANDPSLIAPLAGFLQENLSRIGFADETIRTQIGMAIVEAISNAMIHGNLEVGSELRRDSHQAWEQRIAERRDEMAYAGRKLLCEARENRAGVEYVIEDQGPGFDIDTLPDPRAPQNLLKASGRGVLLIRTFMDEVEYQKGGARIVMRKSAAPGEGGEASPSA